MNIEQIQRQTAHLLKTLTDTVHDLNLASFEAGKRARDLEIIEENKRINQ